MRRVIATVVLLTLLAAACSSQSNPQSAQAPSSSTAAGNGETPKTTEAPNGETPTTKKRKAPTTDPDTVVEQSLDDVEAYWKTEMPEVYGIPYETLTGGRHPYDSETPPPSCGGQRSTYEEQKHNAFYCPPDDLIAWDREDLIPSQVKEFGGLSVAIVLA